MLDHIFKKQSLYSKEQQEGKKKQHSDDYHEFTLYLQLQEK